MPATFINSALVLLGSFLGIAFKNHIGERFIAILTHALGLCVVAIGISSAIGTQDTLCVIICMVLGCVLGEALRIEDRLGSLGEVLRRRRVKGGGNSRFTEGFVTASVLFCVGSMAIMGAMEAGIHGDWSILVTKGVMDGVTAITFAATMGVGVAFAAAAILIYHGELTLLFSLVGPFMAEAAIVEMSAVGGTIILGIGINMLGLGKAKLKVGNMLPAIFLPLLYLPVAETIAKLTSQMF